MRQDYFIIWPHGLKYVPDIIKTMRDEYSEQFFIRHSARYKIEPDRIESFFNSLYQAEVAEHIRGKTAHIRDYINKEKNPSHIHLIKFDNLHPDEKTFYGGPNKCAHVERLKIHFRNKFNPKFPNSTKQIFPLDKGVSHDHIIHSSDNAEDIARLDNILSTYTEKLKLRVYKIDTYHHKNEYFLRKYIQHHHTPVSCVEEADIILSASTLVNPADYSTKKFIFGPHFGKERINSIRQINVAHQNAIYIQPSQPSVDLWLKELNFTTMPVISIPFGVDTDIFCPTTGIIRKNVLIYYKTRNPKELEVILSFLNDKGLSSRLFNYDKRYSEKEYLKYLSTCKFGIWVGRHESQGFALEEALAMNVPLLVWNVTQRVQEYGSEHLSIYKTPVSTIPYWDSRCGEFFYDGTELPSKYAQFLQNLDEYEPRQFALDTVGYDKCRKLWDNLLYGL